VLCYDRAVRNWEGRRGSRPLCSVQRGACLNLEPQMGIAASVLQALGALEWVLVELVLNVRTRTAVAFRQDLDKAGIDIPASIIESRKWFRAFRRAPSIAQHQHGFGGLLRDRLMELGFEEDLVREAIKGLEYDLVDLCLDVQSAVTSQLRRDLEANGVRVPASILESSKWRDVFTRDQGELPPGAASIVREGSDCNVFRVVEQRREVRCHGKQGLH